MTRDPDPIRLYRLMARARAFEMVVADLWDGGLVSGEMHLGTGEEAIAAGVAVHLRDDDAVSLDHRPAPMLVMRGVEPRAMLDEMLGRETGLCRGRGGHMHLLSAEHLAASSGIVGASAPLGAGFALAARALRPGAVAVALFGEGAMNQGMLLETLNLAPAWSLPLVLVCKDNGWAATTESGAVTSGDLVERARAFGLPAEGVDGGDAERVARAVGLAVERARRGRGPSFLLADCPRLDGHFLGDEVRRIASRPVAEGRDVLGRVAAAAISRRGGGVGARATGLAAITRSIYGGSRGTRGDRSDPLERARRALRARSDEVAAIDAAVADEMGALLAAVVPDEPEEEESG